MNSKLVDGLLVSLEQAKFGKLGELADFKVFQNLLDILESHNLLPDRFDLCDDPKSGKKNVEFNRGLFIDLLSSSDKHITPVLYRDRYPSYEFSMGYFMAKRISPRLYFYSSPGYSLASSFSIADDLCQLFQPIYAGVTFYIPDEMEGASLLSSMLIHNTTYKYGFDSIAVRNYLDSRLSSLLNLDELASLGVDVTMLDWGAIRLDLLPDPGMTDLDQLYRQIRKVNSYLSDQNLIGDYSRHLFKKPALNWKSVTV